jgi:replicative DNA helicase Mcm
MSFKDEEIIAGWEDILSKRYRLKVSEVADQYPDKRSITVSYADIDDYNPDLALFMLQRPDRCLALGRKVIKGLMPPAWDSKGDINIRITELPRDHRVEIRSLRQEHLRRYVCVEGLVRKVTSVKPRMTKALFKCAKCDAEMWVDQHRMRMRKPSLCTSSDGSCNKSGAAQFTLIDEKSVYIDTQRIEIQESPEGLRGGAQPERLTGYLEDDLAGAVFPGNRVMLNGIIRPVQKGEKDDSLVFDTFIEVHSVEFEQHEYDEIPINDDDIVMIEGMSKDPEFFDKLIRSISPTIYGLEAEKEAIALQLFGGTQKEMDDHTVLRGDIHILLVGDPGVAKSQLLRQMSQIAPRGIYASGKSASAAGLCVHGDTRIHTPSGEIAIGEFVNARMPSPEEYRPGIFRQPVTDGTVAAVTENGFLKGLPVTYVWRIRTPPFLVEIITKNDDRLLLTEETKIMAGDTSKIDWIRAGDIKEGMLAMVSSGEKMILKATEIKSVSRITDVPEFVYDLTVDDAHSFIGNGFAVHNTAAAVKDDFGDGRFTLEAGALVLADKGLACVDELDKMSEQDTSALHEAMESQRISVAKAGITATLQCRCSLLAAGNPKNGRFDENKDIGAQIDLPPTLMSRFDLIFAIRDKPNADNDKRITDHIIGVHRRGQAKKAKAAAAQKENAQRERIMDETASVEPVYDVETLRKYVAYSKQIVPVMTEEASAEIREMYLNIRKTGGGNTKAVPITARQLEAYIRLAEASARARLSDVVTREDAKRSIRLIHYYLEKIFGREGSTTWDSDIVSTGIPANLREEMEIVREIIRNFAQNTGTHISKGELFTELRGRMKDYTESQLDRALDKLMSDGAIFSRTFDRYDIV